MGGEPRAHVRVVVVIEPDVLVLLVPGPAETSKGKGSLHAVTSCTFPLPAARARVSASSSRCSMMAYSAGTIRTAGPPSCACSCLPAASAKMAATFTPPPACLPTGSAMQ